MQVTCYKLLFIARITSCHLHTKYELLFIARVTSYFLNISYALFLMHNLWVTIYCTSVMLIVQSFSTIWAIHFYGLFAKKPTIPSQLFISMAYSLQNQVFLASYSWAINFMSAVNYTRQDCGIATEKFGIRVLTLQRRIFISKLHVWQMESYSYQTFPTVPSTIYWIRNYCFLRRLEQIYYFAFFFDW